MAALNDIGIVPVPRDPEPLFRVSAGSTLETAVSFSREGGTGWDASEVPAWCARHSVRRRL
jgi:hypothetical protein